MHYGISVTNASKPIVPLPAPRLKDIPAWATNVAYAIGNYVTSKGRGYMAVTAGNSGATAPEGVGSVSDGTVTWISCNQHPRKGLTITNEGGIALSISLSGPAVAGSGTVISAGATMAFLPEQITQDGVFAIRAAATAGNVSILEW